MDYWTGVLVAVLWPMATLVINVFSRFGTMNTNMRRVGLRKSLLTGEFKETGNLFVEFLGWVFWTVVMAPLSWVGVGLGVVWTIYLAIKASGAPQALKDFRWKLRNVEMSEEQIRSGWAAVKASLAPAPAPPPVNLKNSDGEMYWGGHVNAIRRSLGAEINPSVSDDWTITVSAPVVSAIFEASKNPSLGASNDAALILNKLIEQFGPDQEWHATVLAGIPVYVSSDRENRRTSVLAKAHVDKQADETMKQEGPLETTFKCDIGIGKVKAADEQRMKWIGTSDLKDTLIGPGTLTVTMVGDDVTQFRIAVDMGPKGKKNINWTFTDKTRRLGGPKISRWREEKDGMIGDFIFSGGSESHPKGMFARVVQVDPNDPMSGTEMAVYHAALL